MFLLLLLLLIGIPLVNSDYTMLISWGQPTDCRDPITIDTSSWDTCVQLCYLDIYCVLAHGTSEFCHHYRVGKVNGAQKLTSASGSKVALKSTETSSSTCASGLSSLSGTSTTVVITDPNVPSLNVSYTLSFSDDTWSFDFSATNVCPEKWQVFFRPTTVYCIRVFLSFQRLFDQATARASCYSLNATLAGLEADEEREYVTSQVSGSQNVDTMPAAAVWVSGNRKPNCLEKTDGSKPDCDGLNAFNFTDKYLTNKSGYQWAPNQPDSYTANVTMQNCIQLWSIKDTNDGKHGKVDDNNCDFRNASYFAMRGYACGRVP